MVIAADEAAMRALADTAPLFAPDVEVLTFPAWDCLPYDRASPALRVMAERLATLNALQAKTRQAAAAGRRPPAPRPSALLTPFRIRQLTRRIAEGERIDREALIEQLNALGYQRADTVAEHGEYAVRGSLIDLFPAGEDSALRLDFFGDEIDSLRRFDPADQRSTDKAKAFTLMPASEALLDDDSIKRFRSRYRETFGANATQDPLYQALSEGRRMAGMEHWLPLLEERLDDPVRPSRRARSDPPRRRRRPGARGAPRGDRRLLPEPGAGDGSRSRAATARSSRTRSISPRTNGTGSSPSGRSTSPRPSPSPNPTGPSTSAVEAGARFRARARPAGQCLRSGRGAYRQRCAGAAARSCSRATPAARASGCRACSKTMASRRRSRSTAGRRRSAPRPSRRCSSCRSTTASPRADVAVLTEQDMLGDRLVRRRKKRKAADAFLAELATLSPGDLVVHADHGIGRYEGLTQIPVSKVAARLRRARICARQQALRSGREYRAAVAATAARARASRSTASAAKRGSGASRG